MKWILNQGHQSGYLHTCDTFTGCPFTNQLCEAVKLFVTTTGSFETRAPCGRQPPLHNKSRVHLPPFSGAVEPASRSTHKSSETHSPHLVGTSHVWFTNRNTSAFSSVFSSVFSILEETQIPGLCSVQNLWMNHCRSPDITFWISQFLESG